MQVEIKANNLVWQKRKTRNNRLVAWCDALGLTVEADDEAELQSMIAEAHHVLFVDLLEDGELQEFLRDRGWTVTGPIPAQVPEEGVVFEVPYNTVAAAAHAHP